MTPTQTVSGILARVRAILAPPPRPLRVAARRPELAGAGTERGAPREVLRQVRLIELRTRGLVESLFGGEYSSVFKGQGMEFSEVREYQPGDDVRHIDWNVTARMAHPYVKKHKEERELTVLLAVDLSGSGQFGTRGRFKAELAAELAALIALSAIRNNDRVGLAIFTDRIEHFVPPKKGRRHALRLIRDLLAFEPRHAGTNLPATLGFAARVLRHRSIVFLLSDFQPPLAPGGGAAAGGIPDSWVRALRNTSQRHDLVAVTLTDPAEWAIPDAGVLLLADPETGQELAVDTGHPELRAAYQALIAHERQALQRTFRQLAIDEIGARTDESYIGPLLAFFRQRERKRGR